MTVTISGPIEYGYGSYIGKGLCSSNNSFYVNVYTTTPSISGCCGIRYTITCTNNDILDTITVNKKSSIAYCGVDSSSYPCCSVLTAPTTPAGNIYPKGSTEITNKICISIYKETDTSTPLYRTTASPSLYYGNLGALPDDMTSKDVSSESSTTVFFVDFTFPTSKYTPTSAKSSYPYFSALIPYLTITETHHTKSSNVEITASVNDIEEYGSDAIEYINLEENNNTISGTYTVTSDYGNSSSYLKIGGVTKSSSLTYNSATTFSYSSISPAIWSSPQTIELYAINTQSGNDTFTKSVRFYGAPVGYDHSGVTPTYKKDSSQTIKYYAFDNYGLNQVGLSVSCSVGSATIDSSSSDGTVYINYTPDTSSCGSFTSVITLTDNFTGTSYTATSNFSYVVYNPPEVSFTPETYTPTYNETVTFVNTSTEISGESYEYFWKIDNSPQSSYTTKSNLTYTFSNFNSHTITLQGVNTSNDSDYTSVSHTYVVPSYVPDVVFNPIGSVYVTIPVTASIVVDPTKEGITYTWYFKANAYDTYTKVQDGGSSYTFTPTITTDNGSYIKVTAEKDGEEKYAELSFLVHEPTPAISFKCYADAEGTTEITSETLIADSSTKVYLQNNSTAVSGTSPTYKWYFNGEEITPISTLNTDLPYFIPSVSSTGQFTLELEGTVSTYTSSGSMSLTMISPAPSISIVTSKSTAQYGDTISCSLNMVETVVGVNYTYSWTLNGTQVSTSSTMSFTVDTRDATTYSITAVVSVIGSKTTWTSNTATATVNILESKDPMSRFTLIITNNEDYMICTRNTLSSCRFNNLQFEKRLNETGSGSFDLLINSSEDTDVLVSGSDIIIYDNIYPIYYGVITGVDTNEINPYNVTLSKKYYSIEFSEGCRKLSYIQCSNNEIITSTISSITNKILDSEYIGSVDDYTGQYSFSVSNQDELSQIDSFSEQCGARYRTNISVLGSYNNYIWYEDHIAGTAFETTMTEGSIVYCKKEEGLCVGVVSEDCTSRYELSVDWNVATTGFEDGDIVSISVIKPNPIIDFKRTYYQVNSVIRQNNNTNALIVNKTTYDINDIDSLNKHYGSISCTSPQSSGININRTIKLVTTINPDNTMEHWGYITNSKDGYVVDVGTYYSPTYETDYYYFIVSREYTLSEARDLYCPTTISTEEGYRYFTLGDSQNTVEEYTYKDSNGGTRTGTKILTRMSTLPNSNTAESFKGAIVFSNHITILSQYSMEHNYIYIGGDLYSISNYDSSTKTFDITMDNLHTTNMISIPNGTIVQSYNDVTTPMSDSPYELYQGKTLSVILQSNMSYGDIGLLLSNLVRYGSNFTSNVTGTAPVRDFITSDGEFPMVGDHVALYYNGTQYDYELQSFTVNTQTMTVDFNMGMKPLNIGDVIYRISQNMTTNITTN